MNRRRCKCLLMRHLSSRDGPRLDHGSGLGRMLSHLLLARLAGGRSSPSVKWIHDLQTCNMSSARVSYMVELCECTQHKTAQHRNNPKSWQSSGKMLCIIQMEEIIKLTVAGQCSSTQVLLTQVLLRQIQRCCECHAITEQAAHHSESSLYLLTSQQQSV